MTRRSHVRLTFRHRERRYLLIDAGPVRELLSGRLPGVCYAVRTTYLDYRGAMAACPPEWAGAGVKFRLRRYNDEETVWLETKSRTRDGLVTKQRNRVEGPPAGLVAAGEVTYHREAFERRGLRVTVDSNVIVYEEGGSRVLPRYVVEVKTQRPVPRWLAAALPSEDCAWSKSRWLTGRYSQVFEGSEKR